MDNEKKKTNEIIKDMMMLVLKSYPKELLYLIIDYFVENGKQNSLFLNFLMINFLLDKIYVMGGYCHGENLKSCEMYDIKQNKWLEIAPMSSDRQYFGSVSRGIK